MITVYDLIVLSCVLLCAPGCLSQTLLLATGCGVQSLTIQTGVVTTLLDLNTSVADVQYVGDELYFISKNLIYYSYFSDYDKFRPEPIPISNSTVSQLRYLAIDWVKHHLYYSQDSGVYKGAMLGARDRDAQVISLSGSIAGMTIDPYERVLFLTSSDTISSYNTDSSNLNGGYNFVNFLQTEITCITLDLYYKELYVILSYKQGSGREWRLMRTKYSLEDFELVFSGSQLKGAQMLDVLRRKIVWVDDTNTFFSCILPNCTEENLARIWNSPEPVYSVRYFSPLAQSPNTSVACEALYCSHLCVEVTQYSITCSCPSGMVLNHNNHVCKESSTLLDLLYSPETFLKKAREYLLQWLSSQSHFLLIFIYVCCGLMLALLLCGFCLLPCARKPKKTDEDFEMYSMN